MLAAHVHKDQSGQGEDRTDPVEYENRSFRRQSHCQKSVVNMTLVSLEDLIASDKSSYGGYDDVENREAKSNERNEKAQAHLALGPVCYGKKGQGVSKKIAPSVTHEDLCRVKVITQKTKCSPGNGREGQPPFRIACDDHKNRHYDGAENSNSRGQSVETIDEIYGIHEENEPENCQEVARDEGEMPGHLQ